MPEVPKAHSIPCRPSRRTLHDHVPLAVQQVGIDLLSVFSLASRQVKHLIVAINYFTKWIEVELLSTITATQARKFFWRNIVTHFGILDFMVTDNETQFVDEKFQAFLASYKVKQHSTSVEHPQANI